jgi:hypothetical protein
MPLGNVLTSERILENRGYMRSFIGKSGLVYYGATVI